MSIGANDFSAPAGTAAKFANVGDKVHGVVTYAGPFEERENPFTGKVELQAKIVLEPTDGGEPVALYVKKGGAMAQAIGEALRAANTDLSVGGKLGVAHTSVKDTGKPQPLKLYTAKYEAPVATAAVAADAFSGDPF